LEQVGGVAIREHLATFAYDTLPVR
jgi:hypothetical protein